MSDTRCNGFREFRDGGKPLEHLYAAGSGVDHSRHSEGDQARARLDDRRGRCRETEEEIATPRPSAQEVISGNLPNRSAGPSDS